MAPISYGEMTKTVKDLFERGFPGGFLKISAKLPSTDGIAVKLSGSRGIDCGKLSSSVEIQMALELAGKNLLLTEKWSMANTVQSSLEMKLADNIKSIFELNYEPNTSRKSVQLKNSFTNDLINMAVDVEFQQMEPIITFSGIFRINNSLCGGSMLTMDSYKKKMSKIGYSLMYDKKGFKVTTCITNHSDALLQIYKKVNDKIDVALSCLGQLKSKKVDYGIVVKQYLENGTTCHSKLESNGMFSFGYTFAIREGIKLTFGVKLDAKNFNSGGHKLGMEIEI